MFAVPRSHPAMFSRTQRTRRLATQTSWDEQAMQHGSLKIDLPAHETCLQQLKKALLSEQDSQAKVAEREDQVQQLQDAITQLHQEMSRKDQENLRQLQQLQRLENRLKDLTDQGGGDPNVTHLLVHPETTRAIDELKVELSRRDDTIQRLRRDVLLSHQARDSQSAQLDLQEQRISQLQTERQETELELRRTEGCVQQLQKQLLERRSQQAQDLTQVEKLTVDVCSLQNAALVHHRREELEVQLAQSHTQAAEGQERELDVTRKTEELHAELSTLKAQHSCLIQQLGDREAELQRTHMSLRELQAARERDETLHDAAPQRKRTTEELRSATCREEASRQREEHLCELQVELDRLATLLEKEGQEMQRKLSQREEALGAAREKLQRQEENQHLLHQQLASSQDALQLAATELRSCKREWEKRVSQEEAVVSRLRGQLEEVKEEKERLSSQLEQSQGLSQELLHITEKHRAAQHEVAIRDETVLRLTVELRTAQEQLKSLQEQLSQQQLVATEEVRTLQNQVKNLQSSQRATEDTLQEERQRSSQLQLDKDSVLSQQADHQGALREMREEVQRWQAEVQVQREGREEEVAGLQSELQEARSRLQQREEEVAGLQSELQHSHRLHKLAKDQVEEQDERWVKMQADFSLYKSSHVHSNSDYNSQRCLIQELQQAVSKSREQHAQGHQELSVLQKEVLELREELSELIQLRDSGLAEVLRLQEARDALQEEALSAAQRAQQDITALQGKVCTLEEELVAAEQAVQKRDQLLRRSEADLLEARESLRSRAADVERWAAAARSLEAQLQRSEEAGLRREARCSALRAQLLQRTQQLEEARLRCTDTGQELAQQVERAQLLEGEQQRTQQQLAQQVAEVLKTGQAHRRLQAQIQRLEDRLHTAEHELQDYRMQAEQLGREADESRRLHHSLQQEASRHRQEAVQLQGELTQALDELKASQQQLEEQAAARRALQGELQEEQSRQKELHVRMVGWRERELQQEADRETLQSKLNSADTQLKKQERAMGSLREHVAELQSAIQRKEKEQLANRTELQQCKSELESQAAQSHKHIQQVGLCQDRLAELNAQLVQCECQCREQREDLAAKENETVLIKIDMASLRESYHAKVAQVESLHYQLESTEQKYILAANEVEVLRQSLDSARSDSSRLHQESELVVSNVNQLVRQQKQENTKLTLKMREQSKNIVHLTAEKDHLQESVEGLQIELKRLKAELDEKRIAVEKFQASQASVHDQRCAFAKPRHYLLNTDRSPL